MWYGKSVTCKDIGQNWFNIEDSRLGMDQPPKLDKTHHHHQQQQKQQQQKTQKQTLIWIFIGDKLTTMT
jgi:hypothetical protein